MRIVANILGALLGLAFVAFSLMFLLDMVPQQDPPPAGSAVEHYMAAFVPTGYLRIVKILELIGGVLVAIPRTRAIGLLILGPILVNILLFHQLVAGDGVLQPVLLALSGMALVLLLADGRFGALCKAPHRAG